MTTETSDKRNGEVIRATDRRTDDAYADAFDAFLATLEPHTRDAVTKLMIHTRTRPDDPHMVGVCLTAVATANNTAAQERALQSQRDTLRTLEAMKDDPRVIQGVERIAGIKYALEMIDRTLRGTLGFVGIIAALLAIIWAGSLTEAWHIGYNFALNDHRRAVHQLVCNDLSADIASVGHYWRNTLGLPNAADRLASTYAGDCPR